MGLPAGRGLDTLIILALVGKPVILSLKHYSSSVINLLKCRYDLLLTRKVLRYYFLAGERELTIYQGCCVLKRTLSKKLLRARQNVFDLPLLENLLLYFCCFHS